MNDMDIQIAKGAIEFAPGEIIEGGVAWRLAERPEAMELRLFWRTEGKGTQDVALADTVVFDHPDATDDERFTLRAPRGPYSFSGKLISLIWSLELVALPSKKTHRLDIVIAPAGEEVSLV